MLITKHLVWVSLLCSRFLGCHATLSLKKLFFGGGALRDIPKNGCEGDYVCCELSWSQINDVCTVILGFNYLDRVISVDATTNVTSKFKKTADLFLLNDISI